MMRRADSSAHISSRRVALSGRGRSALRHVPALAETWRAQDARLTLPSGLGRTRVSEMREHRASALMIQSMDHQWMPATNPLREDLEVLTRLPA